MPFPLRLHLIHPDAAMHNAWRARFDEVDAVHHQALLDTLPAVDALVTAGNSYGQMSAGFDAAVVARLGEPIQSAVQAAILDDWLGEQPVGTAFVLPSGDAAIPWLVHAPTMRTPGSIRGGDAVYRATLASFVAVYRHRRDHPAIESVALPAMGTGFGAVPFDEAARQMRVAYDHYLHPPHRLDWDEVIRRERAVCYDGDTRAATGR